MLTAFAQAKLGLRCLKLPACPSFCAEDGLRFFVEYDQLAITTGSQGSTFGIPGVEQYTHFLRCAPLYCLQCLNVLLPHTP
jgi:hypothetical protein